MALIKCPECGNEVSDKAGKCPNCGYPIQKEENTEYFDLYDSVKTFKKNSTVKDKKENKTETGYTSTGRTIVGIIFIVLSAAVLFQSCAAGMVNALGEGSGSDGLIGTFTALLMIIIGMVSIVTRKTANPMIPLIIGVILAIYGFLIGYIYKGIFGDLKFYGWLIMICSLVFFAGFKRLNKNN